MNEVLSMATKAADMAKSLGASDARAVVNRERYVNIKRSENDLSQVEESSSMQLSTALFVEGRYSTHTTSDLREDSLRRFLQGAISMTRYLAPDPHQALPPAERYKEYVTQDLKMEDPDYSGVTTEMRKIVALELDQIARGAGQALNNVEPFVNDSISEMAIVNTNGFSGYLRATDFWHGLTVTADDQGSKKVSFTNWQGDCFRNILSKPATVSQFALQRLNQSRGGRPITTQKLPMLVENRSVGRMAGMLVGPMGGYSLQQKQSCFEGKRDTQIGSSLLTFIDDPFIPSALGSSLFDGEGLPRKKRVMIEKGVIRDFWVNVYYGNKLGWAPTSGSPTNLLIQPGSSSPEQIMKTVGKGILVTGFLGGNSNSTTGDFSVGVDGFYFEKGEIVHAVREMNVAGNLLTFWKQLAEVANDPWTSSSMRFPSLLFNDVHFSGV